MPLLRKVHRFQALGREERVVFLEAAAGVLLARAALGALPFRAVHSLTSKLKHAVLRHDALRASHPSDARVVALAVERAGRQIPGARCLARALAGSVLLARHGHSTDLRIGVRRPDGEFQAHAWLEHGGEVVVGGPESSGFVAFPEIS
jgi:hypothetical protein